MRDKLEIGKLGNHDRTYVEFSIMDDTTPTTVIERYKCYSCEKIASTQDELAGKSCS